MQKFTGLQAADMFAWETNRYARDFHKTGQYSDPSAHFKQFLQKGLMNGEFYDREKIKTLVKNVQSMPSSA